MGRRVKLAHVVELDAQRPALVTHAGVVEAELAHLNCRNSTPFVIASNLNTYLQKAVDAVSQNWAAGIDTPLDLAPLHIAGGVGQEGRGLLYKRPTTQVPKQSDLQHPARRFQLTELPRGLHQICGHTQHKKCRTLMPGLVGDSELHVARSERSLWVISVHVIGLGPICRSQTTLVFGWLIQA